MRSKGYSLIEILVALFILSVGLLAIAGMQLVALKDTESAYLRTIAIVQAASMLQRLEANETVSTRLHELKILNKQNESLLPQGKGEYHCVDKNCCIDLTWLKQGIQNLQFGKCYRGSLPRHDRSINNGNCYKISFKKFEPWFFIS